MQRVLILCATIVSFSTARGDDIREQVRIDNAFVGGQFRSYWWAWPWRSWPTLSCSG